MFLSFSKIAIYFLQEKNSLGERFNLHKVKFLKVDSFGNEYESENAEWKDNIYHAEIHDEDGTFIIKELG